MRITLVLLALVALAVTGWLVLGGPDDGELEPLGQVQVAGELEPPAAAEPATEPEPDPDARLAGRVVDPAGEPVPGVAVELQAAALAGFAVLDADLFVERRVDGRAVTGEDGRFEFDVRPGRAYELELLADGFATRRVAEIFGGNELEVALTAPAAARFEVLDATSGAPVAAALVELWRRDGSKVGSGSTDADGGLGFPDLEPGWLIASVAAPGLVGIPRRLFEVVPGEPVTVTLALQRGLAAHGRITDALTGAPIATAEVGVGWNFATSARTDAEGHYRLEGLGGQPLVDIHVRAPGYGEIRHTRSAAELAGREPFDLTLSPARRAFGRVVDDEGQPLEGAIVVAVATVAGPDGLRNEWIDGETDLRGIFELDGLAPEVEHQLLVRHEGRGTRVVDFPENELDVDEVDLEVIELARGSRVEGSVVDEHGAARPGVEALLIGYDQGRGLLRRDVDDGRWTYLTAERRTHTDGRGRFHFADVAAGTYRVLVRQPASNVGIEESLIVPRARVVDHLAFHLPLGRSIRGRVTGLDGAPVGGVVVEGSWMVPASGDVNPVRPPVRSWVRTLSGRDGGFALEGVGDAAIELTTSVEYLPLAAGELPAPSAPVVVGEGGDEGEIVLGLRRPGLLEGTLTLADGRPAEGLLLRLVEGGEGGRVLDEWRVRGDGRFAFPVAAEARYDLIALRLDTAAGGVPVTLQRFEGLEAAGADLALRLNEGP